MQRDENGMDGFSPGYEVEVGGEPSDEEERTGITEEGGQGNKAGGRKRDEGPVPEIPEERASAKLLDREIRKDEHESSAEDPEAFNMKMAKNKNLDQPNGEIN